MSNIYIQEPPTSGKVLLHTTVGDIDVELWAREAPKACRNFVQLCLENYYDNTIFHRLVKGFIVQGGDPTGTGEGGESIYGDPFKDEFHTRLRFNRRGLVAMANAGKDDNGSQFFFTLGPAPELQNKHTIFAKVVGDTLYNMLKLEAGLVNRDERPEYPQKIISTEVLTNPFPDIVPRAQSKEPSAEDSSSSKKRDKRAAVKNFKLLSFGEEAEEDEEESTEVSRKLAVGRAGKSAHDMLQTPELSAVPAVGDEEPGLSGDEDEEMIGPVVDAHLIRDKLKRKADDTEEEDVKTKKGKKHAKKRSQEKEDLKKVEEVASEEDEETQEKKLERLRQEYKDLKSQLRAEKSKKKAVEKEKDEEKKRKEEKEKEEEEETAVVREFQATQDKYRSMRDQVPKKGPSREDFTLQLLAKFQKKLATAKDLKEEKKEEEEKAEGSSAAGDGDDEGAEDDDDASWMTHKLEFEKGTPVLAKDASTKDDDWFEIYDPRNPINKRRRGADTGDQQKGERRDQHQHQHQHRHHDRDRQQERGRDYRNRDRR